MKKTLIITWLLWVLMWLNTFATCIQWSWECNDTINSEEIPSDQDIKLWLDLWLIKATTQEIDKYWLEQIKAYYRSLKNWITTKESVKEANMEWEITRAELAKMISNYAINILKKEKNTDEECIFNDITNELDIKYDNGITHACELWLMWQNIKEFRPNDWVTRAEFGTVLSRALWWNKNEWGSTYYENHLKALKAEWIMNKIDTPTNREIRWYVMLMLMRSIDDTPQIQKKSDIDNQISDVIKMLE